MFHKIKNIITIDLINNKIKYFILLNKKNKFLYLRKRGKTKSNYNILFDDLIESFFNFNAKFINTFIYISFSPYKVFNDFLEKTNNFLSPVKFAFVSYFLNLFFLNLLIKQNSVNKAFNIKITLNEFDYFKMYFNIFVFSLIFFIFYFKKINFLDSLITSFYIIPSSNFVFLICMYLDVLFQSNFLFLFLLILNIFYLAYLIILTTPEFNFYNILKSFFIFFIFNYYNSKSEFLFNYLKTFIMKSIPFLLIFFTLTTHAQTTITSNLFGRDCFGGSGLCGGVESIGTRSANNKVQAFYLVLNQEKLTAEEVVSVQNKNELLQCHLKTDWVLDSQTIAEHNLEPTKPLIKAGIYPIERQDGQLKILFTLMPLDTQKVNKK